MIAPVKHITFLEFSLNPDFHSLPRFLCVKQGLLLRFQGCKSFDLRFDYFRLLVDNFERSVALFDSRIVGVDYGYGSGANRHYDQNGGANRVGIRQHCSTPGPEFL